jgi:hypothetical protein
MMDKVSLKAMIKYETLTGKNAMELFQREHKSATDLAWLVFIIKYTKDQTLTFDTVENYSTEEFQAAISSITEDKKVA